MRVHAAVFEGTFTAAFVEEAARDLAERAPVLLAKCILNRTRRVEE